jgi:hypothetical protein
LSSADSPTRGVSIWKDRGDGMESRPRTDIVSTKKTVGRVEATTAHRRRLPVGRER